MWESLVSMSLWQYWLKILDKQWWKVNTFKYNMKSLKYQYLTMDIRCQFLMKHRVWRIYKLWLMYLLISNLIRETFPVSLVWSPNLWKRAAEHLDQNLFINQLLTFTTADLLNSLSTYILTVDLHEKCKTVKMWREQYCAYEMLMDTCFYISHSVEWIRPVSYFTRVT